MSPIDYKNLLSEDFLVDSLRGTHQEFGGQRWCGIGDFKCIADGEDITKKYKITTFYPSIKTIRYYPVGENGNLIVSGKGILEKSIHPEKAEFYLNNELMVSW